MVGEVDLEGELSYGADPVGDRFTFLFWKISGHCNWFQGPNLGFSPPRNLKMVSTIIQADKTIARPTAAPKIVLRPVSMPAGLPWLIKSFQPPQKAMTMAVKNENFTA